MWGAEFVPQTKLLPLADLVITHGGNNTVTETMHFGKPMVVLPLFWDQYDNAQRVDERGYGTRLASYGFSARRTAHVSRRSAGRRAVAGAVGDAASRRIRAADGVGVAAGLIESLARSR